MLTVRSNTCWLFTWTHVDCSHHWLDDKICPVRHVEENVLCCHNKERGVTNSFNSQYHTKHQKPGPLLKMDPFSRVWTSQKCKLSSYQRNMYAGCPKSNCSQNFPKSWYCIFLSLHGSKWTKGWDPLNQLGGRRYSNWPFSVCPQSLCIHSFGGNFSKIIHTQTSETNTFSCRCLSETVCFRPV